MEGKRAAKRTVSTVKGRRRFQADLRDAREAFEDGIDIRGLWITGVRHGEDEGLVLCTVFRFHDGQPVVNLQLLASDTTAYPTAHHFLCFTEDADVPNFVLDVIQTAPEQGPRTIREILDIILNLLVNRLTQPWTAAGAPPEVVQPEREADNDHGTDQDNDIPIPNEEDFDPNAMKLLTVDERKVDILHHDFKQCTATGFRPGIRSVGDKDLVISVSTPAIQLANAIAPRALLAWDPRLLSASRYLTLVISGIRDVYPILSDNGELTSTATNRNIWPVFKIGLTSGYKPSVEQCFDFVSKPAPHSFAATGSRNVASDATMDVDAEGAEVETEPSQDEIVELEDTFAFSLSTSLEALVNDRFLKLLQYRLKYGFGWAAAEALACKLRRVPFKPDEVMLEFGEEILAADEEEREMSTSYNLPPDPLDLETLGHLNLPLIAFCYLLRRLILCARFCLVCYEKIKSDFHALKPYVCDNPLCTYQYYNINLGPSLEYEICSKPQTVDLLVSLLYVASAEDGLRDFPDNMNLMVKDPRAPHGLDPDEPNVAIPMMCEFDTLPVEYKRVVINKLLDSLPRISQMKRYLQRKVKPGMPRPRLRDMDQTILPAAWALLRWCVASCTAHLEEVTDPAEMVTNIEARWRQFRFTVGSPDAEAEFATEQQKACEEDENARRYPSLYGFHGSPAKNWHSIIRHGLWCKERLHGRSFGDGVYFAKAARTSANTYAKKALCVWSRSELKVDRCVTLAELVNRPSAFVHTNTNCYVVAQTEWIICRYLMVATNSEYNAEETPEAPPDTSYVELDPSNHLSGTASIGDHTVAIPWPLHGVEGLLEARRIDLVLEPYDALDAAILADDRRQANMGVEPVGTAVVGFSADTTQAAVDDWVHDPAWAASCVDHVLTAPENATHTAVLALQHELRAMLCEQDAARSLKQLGWYLPSEFIGDNLFQWIIELHSFGLGLPVTQDMAASRNISSLVCEIQFPPNFPHAPPFFRIIKPRFLPFSQGGGGHVTTGGSMCMDLLTADGWLPSYSVSALLLQIRLAISNLDPRPARLAADWNRPYSMQEALQGFKRAANVHGWKVPDSLPTII